MTRAEAFDKAWRIGIKEKDFSFVYEIYHPDYKAVDAFTDVECNIEADIEVIKTIGDTITVTKTSVLYERDDFLKVHRYGRHKDADIFHSVITELTYKDAKIISQKTTIEELETDPSEGQDWKWEEYE